MSESNGKNGRRETLRLEVDQPVIACVQGRYQRRDHELRDHRPEHWRKYL